MNSRLSLAGYFAAAGPSAKAFSTLVVTCVVNDHARLFSPKMYVLSMACTQRIVPVANTPAPLLVV